MSAHAVLPPSSAKEWGNCDAWMTMNAAAPPQAETDEARWGTECHELASAWLLSWLQNPNLDAPKHDDREMVEMVETAEMYVRHCLDLARNAFVFGGPNVGVESRLHMLAVHEQVWGTTDFYLYRPDRATLFIRDFKTGHLLVEPDDSQLVLYAWGVIEKLGLNVAELQVDLGVVQPRGFHRKGPIRNEVMRATDLKPRIAKLRERAAANLAGGGRATAGEHCRNCAARTRCPAAIAAGPELLAVVTEGVPVEPTPQDLGLLLRWTRRAIKHLEQMEKAYSGEIEGHVRAGAVVPGWAMEATYARSKEWTRPEPDVLMLGQMFGTDLSKPGLITPTQAEKKGIPSEIINGYCTRPQTGVKLIEVSDDTIANIFGAK